MPARFRLSSWRNYASVCGHRDCELDFNLNATNMKFIGPKVGTTAPTVTYNLAVLNGMLVGTTPGFTAVIVFGTPSAVPIP